MHILCPHCSNPIEIVDLAAQCEVSCPSCGSSFRLDAASTTDWQPTQIRLGKFDLLDKVGQGAFGTVYKARDPELDRIVAIKVPRAENLPGPSRASWLISFALGYAQIRASACRTEARKKVLDASDALIVVRRTLGASAFWFGAIMRNWCFSPAEGYSRLLAYVPSFRLIAPFF